MPTQLLDDGAFVPASVVLQRLHDEAPMLRYLEKMIHLGWPTPLEATKRCVGTVVPIHDATIVFNPIPAGNVVPALKIALITMPYREADGLVLAIALPTAVIMLVVAGAAIWETVRGTKCISRVW